MTVSNAYNRPDQLSPELRARVMEAAERLGYSGPDPVARTLSRGKTGSVGLVLDYPLTIAFNDPGTDPVPPRRRGRLRGAGRSASRSSRGSRAAARR